MKSSTDMRTARRGATARIHPARGRLARSIYASLMLMAGGATPAWALPAADAAAQAPADDGGKGTAPDGHKTVNLNAVVIKATREIKDVTGGALGSVSKLNMPFSVSAVPSEVIQDKQPASVYGVFANDASVTRQAGSDYTGWSSFLTVRGITISSTDGSQKINGVPVTLWGMSLPMEFMDQVQLLKGASGFMYGFATPGGAVNYVTKKPPEEGSLTSFDVGYHSNSIYREHVDIGRAAGDGSGLGFRLNATHEEGHTQTGTGVHRNAFGLNLGANLADNLQWSFDSIYQKSRFTKPSPMVFLTSYTQEKLPGTAGIVQNPQADQAFDNPEFVYLGTGVRWTMAPNWSADLSVAYSNTDQLYSKDYLALIDAGGRYQDRIFETSQSYSNTAAQLVVNGDVDVFGKHNHVVLGATKIRHAETKGMGYEYQKYVNYGYRNLYVWKDFSYQSNYGKGQQSFPDSSNSQAAAFASDMLDLSAKWKVLLGVRFTHYKQMQNTYTFKTPANYTRAATYVSTNETTPTVAVMYKPTTDSTAYASYAEALESGGPVGAQYANVGQLLNPQKSKQWEVGYKVDGLRIQSSVAAFRVDRGTGYANDRNVFVQSGISRYQGLDGALDVHFTRNLTVGASAVYLQKADYLNASSPWLLGKRVPGAYRFGGALHLDYTVPGIEGLAFGANARYTGETVAYQNATRRLTIKAPSYVLFDFSAKYAQMVGGHLVTYRAGINNAFNKSYWIGGSATYIFLGDPRSYFLNVTLDL
ncbi:TonB-dependent siderophore receptor [Frateuria defendens]|uniref:TonB-dependent siderophore receptor n=1 Tax=Frateuria defendens TaxID=2219559 RepID=UPI000B189E1F|nr:TonB-dependent receptor [Frateuria defendens]